MSEERDPGPIGQVLKGPETQFGPAGHNTYPWYWWEYNPGRQTRKQVNEQIKLTPLLTI
jgi:hypothetical protein